MMMRAFLGSSLLLMCGPLSGLTVQVDYRYDTNGFFADWGNPQGATGAAQARAALEAAAARWSAVLDQELLAVDVGDEPVFDIRIGFNHPGTGASFQVSSAAGAGTDYLVDPLNVPAADEYRGRIEIPKDTWVLYAGGRSNNIVSAGEGGTGTGSNLTDINDDPNSHLNRGFNVGSRSLPVWGGSIVFKSDLPDWHFDHTVPSSSSADLYSIALHEIGHALGLSLSFSDWLDFQSGDQFSGPNALAAYNADNGANRSYLEVQAPYVSPQMPGNLHWKDQEYQSIIFPLGNPNYVGTVGAGNLQDLLLDPIANFVFPTAVRRFEITNVDIGAAQDLGWSVITSGEAPDLQPRIARSQAGKITVTWQSQNGAGYTIQRSTTLNGDWANVTTVTASGSTAQWEETPGNATLTQYYRVVPN